MMSIENLAEAKYLSLTTFRGDGTPVATPVWLVRDGDHLYVMTESGSGKVKRIRANSTVELAPCDMRGSIKGDCVSGHAVIQDAAGTAATIKKISKRYGLMFKLMGVLDKIPGRTPGERVGVEITIGSSSSE
jgi:PPOX class probable F420-dependent enzyme